MSCHQVSLNAFFFFHRLPLALAPPQPNITGLVQQFSSSVWFRDVVDTYQSNSVVLLTPLNHRRQFDTESYIVTNLKPGQTNHRLK